MILRELFYFDKDTMEPEEDDFYEPSDDESIISVNDTRKTKLSLKDINRARKSSDMNKKVKQDELDFVKQMYGITGMAQQAPQQGI